jgi:hypothetical protein
MTPMPTRHTITILALLTLAMFNLGAGEPAANTGTIAGIITGTDGKPAATRDVAIYPSQPEKGGGPNQKAPKPIATVKTNDKGEYTVPGVPPGTYRLIAGVPFRESAMANVTVKAGQRTTQNLTLKGRRVY